MNLQLVKAILILPGTALVYVPGAILWMSAELGLAPNLPNSGRPRFWAALVLGVAGLAFAVWTTNLFRVIGKGTPGP